MNVIIYAPEDRAYLDQLLACLPDAQALAIQSALVTLGALPIHYVLLFMSVHLLYALLCKPEYENLYQRLLLYQREQIIVIVLASACTWEESFSGPVFPAQQAGRPMRTLRGLRPGVRAGIYEHIAAAIV